MHSCMLDFGFIMEPYLLCNTAFTVYTGQSKECMRRSAHQKERSSKQTGTNAPTAMLQAGTDAYQ